MSIQQIGSLFIQVSDLDRSISFYTTTLGLVCRGIENWGDGKRGATLFFDPHPQQAAFLTLVEKTDSAITSLERPMFNLICKDAKRLHESLTAQGGQVTPLKAWESPWNRHLMFDVTDPDGHPISLIEMIPLATTTS